MTKIIPFRSLGNQPSTPSGAVAGRSAPPYNDLSVSTQVATIIQEGKPFLVGEWLVVPSLNRLSREGVTAQLELKAIDLLLCLVQHAGEVVSKDTLFDTVWQTEFVSDSSITSRIRELRQAFGDDAQNPRYIETIRKRGYRLIAEVRAAPDAEGRTPDIPESPPSAEDGDSPYPGLAAFTEADADLFFGREAESAALWRKITARRLLAVIGPSGVGKSSLLRAGVVPRAPPGWRVVVFTPGEAPALALARALAPDHSGDPAAMARLLGFNDADTALAVVSRWRGQFNEVVLIVDQFEELFTLNPPEVRASFIELLRRLVDAADVHVVLAMRDDYLYRCQEYDQVVPIFEALTPLPPPTSEGLRRALKEPAARQLYRFQSELMVDRMISEVEGERGALPLMAFAVHRLWEERDREERLLTEEAYQEIGGVSGGLAKHADTTLEQIGFERLPFVRELFRNLVTSEGTRAVREVEELLSVFSEEHKASADEVLRGLIDARLLTGYRVQDDDDQPTRHVEIVHESLLTTWPRLVRWQTQDADAALLRDQLRQAARTWHDRGRPDVLLWTGSAYREYVLWKERYPGGFTDLEEEFASAMTSHAGRQRRRRRLAAAVVLGSLLAVLAVVGTLWQRSVRETRRAEAAKLLALGQLHLEDYPTATLAHAIASLELADTSEARQLAMRALWEGPTAFIVNEDQSSSAEFAPGGERLVQVAQRTSTGGHIRVITSEGQSTLFDRVYDIPLISLVDSNPDGTVLYTSARDAGSASHQKVVLWSLPDGRPIAEFGYAPPTVLGNWWQGGWQRNRFLVPASDGDQSWIHALNFDGTTERLGPLGLEIGTSTMAHDTGLWFAAVADNRVKVTEIGDHGVSTPHELGRHFGTDHRIAFDPTGLMLATSNGQGLIRLWDPKGVAPLMEIDGPPGIDHLELSNSHSRLVAYALDGDTRTTWVWSLEAGSGQLLRSVNCGPEHGLLSDFMTVGWDASHRMFARCGPDEATRLWSLAAPSDAEPLVLRRGPISFSAGVSFHPNGLWLATAQMPGLTLWPMKTGYPWVVIRSQSNSVTSVEFGPDGQWLVSGDQNGVVSLTPLNGEVPAASSVLYDGLSRVEGLAVSPDGSGVLVATFGGGCTLVPLDGGTPSDIGNLAQAWGVAFSPDGRFAVASGWRGDNAVRIHMFDTDTLEEKAVLEPETTLGSVRLDEKRTVLPDGRILSGDYLSGLRIWDPTKGTSELLFEGICPMFATSSDGRRIALVAKTSADNQSPSRVVFLDLDAGTQTHLASHGDRVWSIAMDATGETAVTGDYDGVVRVGSTDGAEPYVLLGHDGWVVDVDIDPISRWIASGGGDGTVRIWPMPDLSKPPLHTLPHDELFAKLKSLTNLRVVRDEENPAGWTLTHDPFPGWETVPSW